MYSDTVIVSECTVNLNVRLFEGLFLRNEKFVDDDMFVPTNWKVIFPKGYTFSLLLIQSLLIQSAAVISHAHKI